MRKKRGEPKGWQKARLQDWLIEIIREIGADMLEARLNGRGKLPARFVDKGKTADNHVIVRMTLDYMAHRARSTTGETQKVWMDRWRRTAQNARLGPFSDGNGGVGA